MIIREMYEKINLKTPIGQRQFISSLNDTLSELSSMPNVNVEYEKITTLEDDISADVLYHNAIVDNIMFLLGAGDALKGEFIRKVQDASLRIWRNNSKGQRIKRREW